MRLTDTIAKLHDPFQVVIPEAGRFLNLCHNVRWVCIVRVVAHDQPPNFYNILRALYKGQSNPIDSNTQHVIQIFSVLGCQAIAKQSITVYQT